MPTLQRAIDFVKYQHNRAKSYAKKNPKNKNIPTILKQFERAICAMVEANAEIGRLRAQNHDLQEVLGERRRALEMNVNLNSSDIEDIPDELFEQLSVTDADRQEFQLFDLIEEHGGVMSLDKILVTLYRTTGEVHDRTKLNQRLYRMVVKGTLHPVPNHKGVYSVAPLDDSILQLDLNNEKGPEQSDD